MYRKIDASLIRRILSAEFGVSFKIGVNAAGGMDRMFVSDINTDVFVVFISNKELDWIPVMEFNTWKQRATLFCDDRKQQNDFEDALSEVEEIDGRFVPVKGCRPHSLAEALGITVKKREVRRV